MNETSRKTADGEDRDLIYKKYVRLSECCIGYIKDSLSDINLLGAIGAVLAWDPVARMRHFETRLNAHYPGAEPLFALALKRPDWQRQVHDRIAIPTFLIFYTILILVPHDTDGVARLRALVRLLCRTRGAAGAGPPGQCPVPGAVPGAGSAQCSGDVAVPLCFFIGKQ
ncbi:MAG: hypothetical protein ABR553_04605 [Gammaproteobacteria bacterium]